MMILFFFAVTIVCFVASAVRCVCRFLLSVRCGGGVVFMLFLFIGYVVWLWAHWLAIWLAIRLACWLFGLLAGGLFGRMCWSARGLLVCEYGWCRCDG